MLREALGYGGKERNKEVHKGIGGKSMWEESLEMDGRDREREGGREQQQQCQQ